MKEGWTYTTLGQVCKLYQPHTISSKEMVEDGAYNVFGANGIIGKFNQYNHEFPEILMTCRGATCGNINISTPKSWINGNAMVIHIEEESVINRGFLVYLLSFVDKSHIITGAAQPQITRQTLSPLVICFPSLTEQERIVEQLDAAFAQIDELKSNAERQLAEARALFQSALTQAMQPKPGWQEKKLKEIADVKGGKRVPKGYKLQAIKTNHPYIRVADFNSHGSIDMSDIQYISDEIFEQIKNYTITDKDLYVSIAGTIGKTGIIPSELNGANLTENACKLVFKTDVVLRYIYLFTLSDIFKKQIEKATKQASQPKLALTRLAEVIISIPSISEQQSIVEQLDTLANDIHELEKNYQKTIAECDALKQALLRQIFE